MIGDFSADPPKVYPHTCSLCDMQCERAKDWIDHVNTVNHTASCRDLRNKYPDWNPNVPRRDPSQGQDASATWQSLERSPSRSVSRSLSWSPLQPPLDRSRRISPPTSHGHAPTPLVGTAPPSPIGVLPPVLTGRRREPVNPQGYLLGAPLEKA
ncbi:zinc finger protein 638-like isoform X2 [Oncorhynchus keta]|uniref:zinc finger protein 638-like isoform X2 n=1 Tax=Oncorhynchus keta TaxID=8018 RepID=UPI00227AE7BC|nr:zinc finger protein 638-like isoform X2 [Oncorhynchus keta]